MSTRRIYYTDPKVVAEHATRSGATLLVDLSQFTVTATMGGVLLSPKEARNNAQGEPDSFFVPQRTITGMLVEEVEKEPPVSREAHMFSYMSFPLKKDGPGW